MNCMKKIGPTIARGFLTLFCLASLTGCELFNRNNGIASVRAKAREESLKTAQALIDCLSNPDTCNLFELLCYKTQMIPSVSQEIEEGISFVKGKIVSYKISQNINGESYGIDRGKIDEYSFQHSIKGIRTDKAKEYSLDYRMFYLNPDKERVGVTDILIVDRENGEEYQIGYPWNSNYYYETSLLAREIIEAFGYGSLSALEDTFAAEALQRDGIGNRLEAALALFKGRPTFGFKTDRFGHETYDGKHDFHHQSLKDEVKIDNYRPTVIYIEAVTANIETDAGKTYSLEWSAYLLNEEDGSNVGVVKLTLTDGEERVEIG